MENVVTGPHEARWLALETINTRLKLGVKSKWPLADVVTRTISRCQSQRVGADAQELCESEITAFEAGP